MGMLSRILGEDPEVRRFKIWAGVFVVWCFTGIMSCDEIKYARHGETAVATRLGDLSSLNRSHATYRWQDTKTGENRKKVLELRGSLPPAQIEMQYIPGGYDSRPANTASWVMPTAFLSLTAMGIGALVFLAVKK